MITLSMTRDLLLPDILRLYKANQWSSADKPQKLYKALRRFVYFSSLPN